MDVDRQMFEENYRLVYKDMYRFALYTLGRPEDAEDAVGDAVMDAWKGRQGLREAGAFKAWIFKILSAKCKRKIKEYVRQRQQLAAGPALEAECAAGDIEQMGESHDLKRAYLSLEAVDRMILSMAVFGGYTSREIGRSLQMKDGTVRSRLSRALDRLEQQLTIE